MPRYRPPQDMKDQRFGRLLVVGYPFMKYPKSDSKGNPEIYYDCLCDCGAFTSASGHSMRKPDPKGSRSCGCIRKEKLSEMARTHGKAPWFKSLAPKHVQRFYGRWKAIKSRCLYKTGRAYEHYGGRGITIYPPWKKDFNAFEAYVLSIHPNAYELMAQGYHIDRINVNGNYEPGNIRLVTPQDNSNNKRDSRFVHVLGEKLTVAQAALRFAKVGAFCIASRLNTGHFSDHEAVLLPALPKYSGRPKYQFWHKKKFPNDISIKEALAPALLPILAIELKRLAQTGR